MTSRLVASPEREDPTTLPHTARAKLYPRKVDEPPLLEEARRNAAMRHRNEKERRIKQMSQQFRCTDFPVIK
jgi:hypothetical protein